MSLSTVCQAGPCAATALGPTQLCASSAECFVAGDTCQVNAEIMMLTMMSISICTAPTGEGGVTEGGTKEGGSEGGASDGGGEASTDAPSGG